MFTPAKLANKPMYLLSAQISEILREISSQKLVALVHFSLLADLHLEVMPEGTFLLVQIHGPSC